MPYGSCDEDEIHGMFLQSYPHKLPLTAAVGCLNLRLMLLIVEVTDDGIQGQQQRQQENESGNGNSQIPSFHVLSSL